MTDEERQRAMDFIVETLGRLSVNDKRRNLRLAKQSDEKEIAERRKLDRDMDRLERVLKRVVAPDPQARKRRREEDKRWEEFVRRSKERSAEISANAARSDEKLKALIDEIQNKRNHKSST